MKNLETNKNYFSESEQEVMCDTEVTTNDTRNGGNYTITNKLYLAYGETGGNYITVGSGLNNGLRVDMDYWGSRGSSFWLRAPYYYFESEALFAIPGIIVDRYDVGSDSIYTEIPCR